MQQLITNSRVKAFHACQRLHYIRYVLGIAGNAPAADAAFGTLMHHGLEGWWLAYRRFCPGHALIDALSIMDGRRGDIDDATFAKATLLMAAYDARWSPTMHEYRVLEVEVQFEAPLLNPATGRTRRGVKAAGKLDAIVHRLADNTVWIVEHKTSGADLSPGSTYWQRLRMDPQVSTYVGGARALGYEVAGCIYDVLVRPEQRPLQATPLELRKYTKATAKEPSRLYSNQREFDETEDEFRERIAAAILEAPESYFARAEVVRLPEELARFAVDVDESARQMLAAGRAGGDKLAVRNADACFRFGRTCEFYPVCSGAGSLDDETQYHKLPSVHPELAK